MEKEKKVYLGISIFFILFAIIAVLMGIIKKGDYLYYLALLGLLLGAGAWIWRGLVKN